MLLLALALQAELLEGLADDRIDARARSEAALWALPASALPRVLELAAARPEQEVRAVAERMRVARAWSELLPGTIRELREEVRRVEEGRADAVARALDRMGGLPPGRAAALALELLTEPALPVRHFALHALTRHPAPDAAPIVPFLKDPATSSHAAEALVAMNATSVVPLAVELFCREGGSTLAAARVLEAFGAGDAAPRIAAAVKERIGLVVWGVRILRATGPSAEAELIDLAPQVSAPRQLEIAEALARIGGPRSLPVLREILRDRPAVERDPLLWAAGDRAWARERFEAIRKDPTIENLAMLGMITELCAADVAAEARDWARATKSPAALALLGAAGGPEDLPGLDREGADRVGSPPRPLPELREDSRLSTPQLLEQLRTWDPRLRRGAVEALAVRGARDAVGPLLRLLDDPSPCDASGRRVWHYAMSALETLSGRRTEGASTAEQRGFWRK